ncbi:MAG: tetratricopeptide repeat protein [Planctomycetota bacterium]|nr:tetratricopeptide repeat protein [Planctomycetota bacterium]
MTTPETPDPESLSRLREVQARQLGFRRRTLGPDDPGTLQSMDGLAETLHALGDDRSAQMMLEEALTVRRAKYGAHSAETVLCAWNLFQVLWDLHATAEMRTLFERDLAWLSTTDPEGLEEELARIRASVEELVERLDPFSGAE